MSEVKVWRWEFFKMQEDYSNEMDIQLVCSSATREEQHTRLTCKELGVVFRKNCMATPEEGFGLSQKISKMRRACYGSWTVSIPVHTRVGVRGLGGLPGVPFGQWYVNLSLCITSYCSTYIFEKEKKPIKGAFDCNMPLKYPNYFFF